MKLISLVDGNDWPIKQAQTIPCVIEQILLAETNNVHWEAWIKYVWLGWIFYRNHIIWNHISKSIWKIKYASICWWSFVKKLQIESLESKPWNEDLFNRWGSGRKNYWLHMYQISNISTTVSTLVYIIAKTHTSYWMKVRRPQRIMLMTPWDGSHHSLILCHQFLALLFAYSFQVGDIHTFDFRLWTTITRL